MGAPGIKFFLRVLNKNKKVCIFSSACFYPGGSLPLQHPIMTYGVISHPATNIRVGS